MLVFYGYKDSYLIDCCFISEMDILQSLITDISTQYQLERGGRGVLAILPVYSDVFIVNMDILRRKVSALSLMITDSALSNFRSGGSAVEIPIVVTIDSSSSASAHVMMKEESRVFYAEFYEHLKSMDLHLCSDNSNSTSSLTADSSCSHSSCTSVHILSFPMSCAFEQRVTLPFFAGWLLGYPAIYRPHMSRAPLSDGTATGSIDRFDNNTNNSLSMVTVIKASITANIHLSDDNPVSTSTVALKSNSSRRNSKSTKKHVAAAAAPPFDCRPLKEVELMGLSIPSTLLEEDPELHYLFNSTMEGVVCRLNDLSAAECAGRRGPLHVQDLQLHYNTYTLPAIVL
jgi:hypothetical protein